MGKLIKALSVVLIIICGALFYYELCPVVVQAVKEYAAFKWLGIGFVAYFILGLVPALKKNEDFLQVFVHELSHTLVGLLFFSEIHSFNADEREGRIAHSSGRFGHLFISLAPYTFPYITYFLLFLIIMIKPEFIFVFEILVGFTWAFHIKCFLKQTGSYQTDLKGVGLFRSYLYIVMAHFFNLSMILLSIRIGILQANVRLFTSYWEDLCQAFHFVVGLFNS